MPSSSSNNELSQHQQNISPGSSGHLQGSSHQNQAQGLPPHGGNLSFAPPLPSVPENMSTIRAEEGEMQFSQNQQN